MKTFLLHRQKDFELERRLPANEMALTQDLGLQDLFNAMAAGDEFLLGVAKTVVLSSLNDPVEILYRQQVLEDCRTHAPVVKEMYDIALAAINGERKMWRILSQNPDLTLSSSVQVLVLFVGLLKQLRRLADDHAGEFHSEGFAAFFAMLHSELDGAYFETVDEHLRLLKFRQGVPISARLGKRNAGTDFVLRRPVPTKWSWRQWIPRKERSAYTIVIPPRDEGGMQALTDLRGRGINLIANALAQSGDHILSFFGMLRFELGFYLACLNLRGQLTAKGEPICFPVPTQRGASGLSARGLYDVGLALRLRELVVGNDVDAIGRSLVVITGANQGGKSTFLRGVGIAQLMMQAGLFVGAAEFRADVRDAVFTHFKREEDSTMTSGKLDEELKRMSEIVDQLVPKSIVLLNESFAATNEREGAQIAGEIVHALLEAGIRVFFVTHSFELAHGFQREALGNALFLRAERRPDGERTFKLIEGEALPTSFGEDLYARVFGEEPPAPAPAGSPQEVT